LRLLSTRWITPKQGCFGFIRHSRGRLCYIKTFRSFAALKDDWQGPVKMALFGNFSPYGQYQPIESLRSRDASVTLDTAEGPPVADATGDSDTL
jgi:hypothetical protein